MNDRTVVRTDSIFEETRHGVYTLVTEWRPIKDHPQHQITHDCRVRSGKTKKELSRNTRTIRYITDGTPEYVSVRKLRNDTYPELDPLFTGNWE